MTYQVLARKWRPRRFAEVVGQDVAVRALSNALADQRLHPALLFSGTRGVGKTTLARIVAKALNCEQGVNAEPCNECATCREIDEGRFVDLIEVDAASRTRVDDTRELLDNVQYSPTRGRYKVYLVDEVHMLSHHSFNALLKTLEEPPPHVKFLLATTDTQKLPITILSRCLQFHLGRLPVARIQAHLASVLEREAVEYEDTALRLVAEAADGSMRDGLSLLDQAIAFGGGSLSEASVREMLGTIAPADLYALLQALADNDAQALIKASRALAEQTPDFEAVLDALAALLQRLAVARAVPEAVGDAERTEALRELAQRLGAEEIQLYYQTAIMGRRDLQWAPDPETGFEMTLLRMAAFRPELDEASAPARAGRSGGEAASAPSRPAAASPGKNVPESAASSAAPSPAGSTGQPPGERATPDAVAQDADWGGIHRSLGLRGMAGQLARHCLLASHDESHMTLRLDPAYQQLLTDRAREQLRQALQKRFGEQLKVRIVVGESQGGETPAQSDARQSAERYRAAEHAIERDPTVNDLKNRFGASIRPDSIHPMDEQAPDGHR